MDRNQSILAEEWISRARDTLRFTEAGFSDTQIPPDACYGSQQAGEKALKAVLAAHGEEPPRTHDTVDLLARVLRVEPSLRGLVDDARVLARYVVEARYPTDVKTDFSAEEAREALQAARRVVEAVAPVLL